jgi:bis(5'-nucleosyl)-tetraphosphatase (symmetrical)
MSTYAIGDLQGCAASFDALLERIAFDPTVDRVWLVGDLVNRGPDSLGALRRVAALGDAAIVVLGNHDLHLLAVAAGVRKSGRNDTLAEILDASDALALLDWLRRRPLAHRETIVGVDVLLVHAGILPGWSADDTMCRAGELEAALRGDAWRATLAGLFGNVPDRWDDGLVGEARLRAIVNVLTRLRFCAADGRIDFDAKDAPALAGSHFPAPPTGFAPWFEMDPRRWAGTFVVFGHWSTLGLLVRDDVIALDSGCVWGGSLTAIRLEDRTVFQVRCPGARTHA